MAAPVRIDATAFADQRYELLGQLAGYSRFEALGRMAHLWSYCTERNTAIVSEAIVRAHLGVAGATAIVEAELGEAVEGGIRVRGASEDRIGWYAPAVERKKAAAKAAGEARAAGARRDARGRLVAAGAGPATTSDAGGEQGGESQQGPETQRPTSDQPAADQRPTSDQPAADQRAPASRARALSQKKKRERALSRPPPTEPPEATALAERLAAAIEHRVIDQPRHLQPDRRVATLAAWARELRLAHVRDGRPWARLREVLDWSQADPFWQRNILSADALRRNFDKVSARMAPLPAVPPRPGGAAPPRSPVLFDGYAEAKRREAEARERAAADAAGGAG